MEKTKLRKIDKNNDGQYVIIAKLKNGRTKVGDIIYKLEDDAHRHWKNLCTFVPMQMKKYIGYDVVKMKD